MEGTNLIKLSLFKREGPISYWLQRCRVAD
jgi:hypothetical protein